MTDDTVVDSLKVKEDLIDMDGLKVKDGWTEKGCCTEKERSVEEEW